MNRRAIIIRRVSRPACHRPGLRADQPRHIPVARWSVRSWDVPMAQRPEGTPKVGRPRSAPKVLPMDAIARSRAATDRSFPGLRAFYRLLFLVVLSTQCTPVHASAERAFGQTHARYAAALSNFVKNGRVDYAGLQSAPQDLDAYLNDLARVTPEEFATWSRENRLALLL